LSYQTIGHPKDHLNKIRNLIAIWLMGTPNEHVTAQLRKMCRSPIFVERRSTRILDIIAQECDKPSFFAQAKELLSALDQLKGAYEHEKTNSSLLNDVVMGLYGEFSDEMGFVRFIADTHALELIPVPKGVEHAELAASRLGVSVQALPFRATGLVAVHAHMDLREGRVYTVSVPYGSGSLSIAGVKYTDETLQVAEAITRKYFVDDTLLKWNFKILCTLRKTA
jgi:hypothetical protein